MYEFFEPLSEIDAVYEDKPMEVDLSDTDCDEAIHDMFNRMGIKELELARNAVYVKKMSYIETEVIYSCRDHKGRMEEHLGTMPLNLIGTIYIYPKGLRIFT